jgi:3-hydroxyisobutyrate dehydrogenase-like beta-hydroxyacid dehydrogenase/alkylhydroperoxidase family enzyme
MDVAWIGLGHMGLPTAKMVAAAGHAVRGYDIRPLAPEETAGLAICASAREAAEGCDLICLSLFSDDQVEEVLAGPDGLFPMLKPGAIIAIFTTGTIESVRKLAAAAPPGIAVLDTCFSRQTGMLASGKMNLLVGGDAEAIERCRKVLDVFANDIFHLGGSGAGRALKLVNNILWVGHIQLAIDALSLAEKLGFDAHETAKIVLRCTGASDVLNVFTRPYAEMVDYMRPFMIKDASAAAEAARAVGADLGTLGDVVRAYIKESPQDDSATAASANPPRTPGQIAARHASITDHPLRVQPVQNLTDEQRELLGPPPGFERYIGRSPTTSKPGEGSEVYRVMAHNPGLLRQFRTMMPFFMIDGLLPSRDRELAVLRAAWMRQIPFVWGEHVVIGKRVGMTSEEMDWVAQGSTAPGWTEHDRTVVRAAEELVDDAMISDPTWDVLAKTLTEAQLIELPLLVGQYLTMGYYQNSLRIRMWEGNAPESAPPIRYLV